MSAACAGAREIGDLIARLAQQTTEVGGQAPCKEQRKQACGPPPPHPPPGLAASRGRGGLRLGAAVFRPAAAGGPQCVVTPQGGLPMVAEDVEEVESLCSTADTSAEAGTPAVTPAPTPAGSSATGRVARGLILSTEPPCSPGAAPPRPSLPVSPKPPPGLPAPRTPPGTFAAAPAAAPAGVASQAAIDSIAGSRAHDLGLCKPCAFVFKEGCLNGDSCMFCHLCQPGEKRRRRKERLAQRRAFAAAKPMAAEVDTGKRELESAARLQAACFVSSVVRAARDRVEEQQGLQPLP